MKYAVFNTFSKYSISISALLAISDVSIDRNLSNTNVIIIKESKSWLEIGLLVGAADGEKDGDSVGWSVGSVVGDFVGFAVVGAVGSKG